MDQAANAASEIVGTTGSFFYYLVLGGLLLVASAFGSFIGEYFRFRGETFATSADIDKLAANLAKTTEAAEEVRTAIQHRFSERAEAKALMRD